MKLKIKYKKVERATWIESVRAFEMDFDEAQINLYDGFWILNLEKSKDDIKLELWQGDQFVITVVATKDSAQTLHLKFYDFDIYFSFEILEGV